jgi:hypothetical protein
VQRGHRAVDPAVVDERSQVAEEQGQQQAPDVRAVGVGVGHQDDLLVAHRVEVHPRAGDRADDLHDRRALRVVQHVRHRRPLDVEDLAPDRQQRLELRVTGTLGGAESGVTLDDEQLAAVVPDLTAVGELGRQGAGLQRS